MTGFGRSEALLPAAGRASIEVHTLNHKFFEVECRLPDGFQLFEDQIRAMVARRIQRGRIRVTVVLKTREPKSPVVFQEGVARQYLSQLRGVQRRLRIPGTVTLETLLGLPKVMTAPERELSQDRWWPHLKPGLERALLTAVKMRRQEGVRLKKALARLAGSLEQLHQRVGNRVPLAQQELQKRMEARISAIAQVTPAVGGAEQASIIAEAAKLVQSSDVTEELARIDSHLKALCQAMGGRVESPGRTIDFLAQELHREVNTLGTKMRDAGVTRDVVAMKGQIEKLREQAANVE